MKNISSLLYFVLGSLLLFLSCRSTTIINDGMDTMTFYVGTSTGDPSEGIYAFKMMPDGGSKLLSKYPNLLNPGFLTIADDNSSLYAIHNKEGQKNSVVSAFEINDSGELKLVNSQSTNGRGGCHISHDSDGDIIVANYSSGSVSLLPTQEDASLKIATSTIQHEGSSINKERQKGPHAHFIQQGTGGLYYAADLGTDKVMLYQKVNDELIPNDPPSITMHPGAGPRHLDFHLNGKYLYVVNELEGSVSTIKFSGTNMPFKILQTISSLPDSFSGFNKSADIHIHPNGNFLYASNRGDHNSIAVYRINKATGLLTLVEIESEAINWPRNFAISPDGKYLLCANKDSDNITFYNIDLNDGSLRFNGHSVDVPEPICIKFR